MPRRVLQVAIALALASCATMPSAPQPQGEAAAAAGPLAAPAPAGRAVPPSDGGAPAEVADLHATPAVSPRAPRTPEAAPPTPWQERLALRAGGFVGRRGPFRAAGERFNGDCSGFAEAVYAAEGVRLRELLQRVAPDEPWRVKAAWRAARAHGRTFGAEEAPAPGDLVFWHDTYDRNRNRKADDPFTHMGIVEYVADGSVHFLHRGGRGVTRGVMTLARRHDASDAEGRPLNSNLRARSHRVKRGGLAGELFAGFGRLDPARLPREYASGRVDPPPSTQRSRSAARAAPVPRSGHARL